MLPRVGFGQGFVNSHVKAAGPTPVHNGIVTEKKKWMQDVKIKRPGICTGDKFGSKSCPEGSRQYALAKTFRKASKASAAKRK